MKAFFAPRHSARMTFAAAMIVAAGAASAADCPANFPGAKPVRLVVGFGAGGGTDAIARAFAAGFEKMFKWTVVVENRPGGSGGVAMVWLKGQPADGYTLSVNATDSVTITPVQNNVTYSWDDFEYLGTGMLTWTALVALAEKPFGDIAGLVKFAKENGRATISVAGISHQVLIAQLADEYKVNFIAVPGTGAAEALTSALGGHVDATTQGTLHIAQIKAGKMKQLASTIDRRVPYAPDSGTLAEQGSKSAPIVSYTILVSAKGLPPAIRRCLAEALDEVIKSADYKLVMDKFENEPRNLGIEGTAKFVQESLSFYKEAIPKLKK